MSMLKYDNLIQQYVFEYCDPKYQLGHCMSLALDDINDSLGRNYILKDLGQWIDGTKPVPDEVMEHCRERIKILDAERA